MLATTSSSESPPQSPRIGLLHSHAPGSAGQPGGAGGQPVPSSGGTAGTAGSTGLGGTAGATGAGGASSPACPTPEPAGLILWLSSDYGVTASPVSRWQDRSSAGNDATQPSPTLQPTLVAAGLAGMPVVHFDGTGQRLELPDGFEGFSAGVSAFFVVRIASAVGWGRILGLRQTTDSLGAMLFERWTGSLDFIYIANPIALGTDASATIRSPDSVG